MIKSVTFEGVRIKEEFIDNKMKRIELMMSLIEVHGTWKITLQGFHDIVLSIQCVGWIELKHPFSARWNGMFHIEETQWRSPNDFKIGLSSCLVVYRMRKFLNHPTVGTNHIGMTTTTITTIISTTTTTTIF